MLKLIAFVFIAGISWDSSAALSIESCIKLSDNECLAQAKKLSIKAKNKLLSELDSACDKSPKTCVLFSDVAKLDSKIRSLEILSRACIIHREPRACERLSLTAVSGNLWFNQLGCKMETTGENCLILGWNQAFMGNYKKAIEFFEYTCNKFQSEAGCYWSGHYKVFSGDRVQSGYADLFKGCRLGYNSSCYEYARGNVNRNFTNSISALELACFRGHTPSCDEFKEQTGGYRKILSQKYDNSVRPFVQRAREYIISLYEKFLHVVM